MYTLNSVEVHAVCYGISSYDSNAMRSPNPHSGIYKAETARTLDMNGGNPACNQGGCWFLNEETTYAFKAGQGEKARGIGYERERAPRCYAVDVRNGVIDECKNASLQARASNNLNSNNVVLIRFTR